MPISVRANTFETNSSSVHALVFADGDACTRTLPDEIVLFADWEQYLEKVKEDLARWIKNSSVDPDKYDEIDIREMAASHYIDTIVESDDTDDVATRAMMAVLWFAAEKSMVLKYQEYLESNANTAVIESRYENRHWISREQVMEALDMLAAEHGTSFKYAVDKNVLCEVVENSPESKYDRGAGTISQVYTSSYSPYETYDKYHAWITPEDNWHKLDILVFGDESGFCWVCEGDDLQDTLADTYKKLFSFEKSVPTDIWCGETCFWRADGISVVAERLG